MCRGKIAFGSPQNVKQAKMTWNKESIQAQDASSSQASSGQSAKTSNSIKHRRSLLMTRHPKSTRIVSTRYKPGRRPSSRYVPVTVRTETNFATDTQTINSTSSPLKRSTTIRRSHAFRKSSRPTSKTAAAPSSRIPPITNSESSTQHQCVNNTSEMEGEQTSECKHRDEDMKSTEASCQPSPLPGCDPGEILDPSDITIEMPEDTQSDISAEFEKLAADLATEVQSFILHFLENPQAEDEGDYDRLEAIDTSISSKNPQQPSMASGTLQWGARESVLSSATNDSGIASMGTYTESISSFSTTTEYSSTHITCPPPRNTYAVGRSRSRSRARVRLRRRPRKIIVVGDMCSGKSSIVSAYSRDRFSENYVPTMLNCCLSDAEVFGEKIELVLIEVAGRDDYKRLRQCAYHKVDAVIVCYSIANATTFNNIKRKWMPELKEHAQNVPCILVGTKKDLRDDLEDSSHRSCERMVSTEQGKELARSIGAQSFHECSALYREGTRDVFETVAKVALRKSRRRRRTQDNSLSACTIL